MAHWDPRNAIVKSVPIMLSLKLPDLLYNLYHQASVHAHSNLRYLLSWTDPMSFSSSSSFCRTELQRALKEQAFGIQNFSITSSSAEQASALVVLLEGQRLVVQLTTEGFSVCKKELFSALATVIATGTYSFPFRWSI